MIITMFYLKNRYNLINCKDYNNLFISGGEVYVIIQRTYKEL